MKSKMRITGNRTVIGIICKRTIDSYSNEKKTTSTVVFFLYIEIIIKHGGIQIE